MSCNDCKYCTDNNTWCNYFNDGYLRDNEMKNGCPKKDTSERIFDLKTTYNICKKFIQIYDNINEVYKISEKYKDKSYLLNVYTLAEFESYALNDLKREMDFYKLRSVEELKKQHGDINGKNTKDS